MKKVMLFVKEGCRPCIMVKKQLERSRDWQDYVELVPSHDAYKCADYNIGGFPTLVIEEEPGRYMKSGNPSELTKSYFEKLFDNLDLERN